MGDTGSQQQDAFVRVKYEQEPSGAIGSRLKRGSHLRLRTDLGCQFLRFCLFFGRLLVGFRIRLGLLRIVGLFGLGFRNFVICQNRSEISEKLNSKILIINFAICCR